MGVHQIFSAASKRSCTRLIWRLLVALPLAVAAVAADADFKLPALTADQIASRLEENNQKRQRDLKAYTSRREYRLTYTGIPGRREADLVVDFEYTAPATKTYKIVSESGSGLIINRVFVRLLDTEKDSARPENQAQTAMTRVNYYFELMGQDAVDGRPAYVLSVKPRNSNKLLYIGKIWVDAADFAVAKVEAEPAQRPSVWISKTTVRHKYSKLGEFWLPTRNESQTDVRLGGHALLSIDYGAYHIAPPQISGRGPQNQH